MTPQFIYILLWIVGLCMAANRHGKTREKKENFWTDLITSFLIVLLLWWGGFFDPIITKLL